MPVCAAPCFSNRAPRDTKKPFTFSFLSDRCFDKQKPLQRNKEFEVFVVSLEAEILVNNIFLYKLFIGVKKINGHSGVNFSLK